MAVESLILFLILFKEEKTNMNKKKILIADDDYDVTASILSILKNQGHDVVTASTGEEALVKFTEFNPEIVFLDLMMEKFDSGVTVCKKIRENNKNVKIYLISAAGNRKSDISEILEMGFNGSLSKPVIPGDILNLLN